MIQLIYIVILIYFLLGGLGFYLINRKKEPQVARESYTKFISYFFIINILFFSITIDSFYFRILAGIIIIAGLVELIRLYRQSGLRHTPFFVVSVVIYAALATGLFLFSGLDAKLVLFSFLILSIFDSFSQITGQLWGKIKLFPRVSPQKTLGGLVGGALIAIASALLLNSLYPGAQKGKALLMAAGVVAFALAGDLAASWYKRRYQVKDYSHLIPGHGGFLDRFDSLIAGGSWVAIWIYLFNL